MFAELLQELGADGDLYYLARISVDAHELNGANLGELHAGVLVEVYLQMRC